MLQLELRAAAGQADAAAAPPPGAGMSLVHFMDDGRGSGGAGGAAPSLEEDLVFSAEEGGDPEAYGAAFDRLSEWVDGSLDMYRVRPPARPPARPPPAARGLVLLGWAAASCS